MTTAFNLLDEPWVPVRLLDGQVRELGLLGVFERAHETVGGDGGGAGERHAGGAGPGGDDRGRQARLARREVDGQQTGAVIGPCIEHGGHLYADARLL